MCIRDRRGDWWNITIPNALIVVTGVLIMKMVISDRHLDPVRTWGLVGAVAAALVAVEYLTTPALFGAAVLIPLAIGMLGQTRDLLRAPNLGGVSGVYLGLVALIQYMWLSWGIAVGDVSIVICATVLGVISVSYTHLDVYKRQGPDQDYQSVITNRQVVDALPADLAAALGTEKVGKEVRNGTTTAIPNNAGPDPVPVPAQTHTPAPKR